MEINSSEVVQRQRTPSKTTSSKEILRFCVPTVTQSVGFELIEVQRRPTGLGWTLL